MNDLNYLPLHVESNIYNMTTLEFDDSTSKVLVVTQDCQIYCISYKKFNIQMRGVEFTYIPSGARIMSIGALRRAPNDFVIGITHSLAPNATQKISNRLARDPTELSSRLTTRYYLNIYASGSASTNFDLDYVAQGCQTISLKYVPYHLFATELVSCNKKKVNKRPVWLLSGGDSAIHCFAEDKQSQSFNEIAIAESFAELGKLDGLALWIDVVNIEPANSSDGGHQRAIALGFEDGSVGLLHSAMRKSSQSFELIRRSKFDDYNTITPSVRLFSRKSIKRSKLRQQIFSEAENRDEDNVELHLLAVNSTEPASVFEDVLSHGLQRRFELADSQRLDCSVTSAIGDTNIDGTSEILIGTHGRELLTYRWEPETSSYCLAGAKELNYPVFAMSILDLTGDATQDVILLLSSGILILQSSVEKAIQICANRLDRLLARLSK